MLYSFRRTPMKMEQGVPQRRYVKFRSRGITYEEEYNIVQKISNVLSWTRYWFLFWVKLIQSSSHHIYLRYRPTLILSYYLRLCLPTFLFLCFSIIILYTFIFFSLVTCSVHSILFCLLHNIWWRGKCEGSSNEVFSTQLSLLALVQVFSSHSVLIRFSEGAQASSWPRLAFNSMDIGFHPGDKAEGTWISELQVRNCQMLTFWRLISTIVVVPHR